MLTHYYESPHFIELLRNRPGRYIPRRVRSGDVFDTLKAARLCGVQGRNRT